MKTALSFLALVTIVAAVAQFEALYSFANDQWNCTDPSCAATVGFGDGQSNYQCAEFVTRVLSAAGEVPGLDPFDSQNAFLTYNYGGVTYDLLWVSSNQGGPLGMEDWLNAAGWVQVGTDCSKMNQGGLVGISEGSAGQYSHTFVTVGNQMADSHNNARVNVSSCFYGTVNAIYAPPGTPTGALTVGNGPVFSEVANAGLSRSGPKWYHSMVALPNNQLLIYGGQFGQSLSSTTTNVATFFSINLTTLTFTQLPNGPIKLYASTPVLLGNTVYFWAGSNNGVRQNTFRTYNWVTNTWGTAPVSSGTPPAIRTLGSAVLSPSNTIVIFGGSQGATGTYFGDLYEYDPSTAVWRQLPNVNGPSKRSGHSAVVYKGKMYLFGGRFSSNVAYNEVWAYDFATFTWSNLTPLVKGTPPSPRASHTGVVTSKGILIVFAGGSAGATTYYNDLFYLDLNNLRWIQPNVPNLPEARAYHASVVTADDVMYSFGGANDGNAFEILVKFSDKTECSYDWQCAPLGTDYNFAHCDNGYCSCRDNFDGFASPLDICRCDTSVGKRVVYYNGIPQCLDAGQCNVGPDPQRYLCSGYTTNYVFVDCIDGVCQCEPGFSGSATAANPCFCNATLTWTPTGPVCQ